MATLANLSSHSILTVKECGDSTNFYAYSIALTIA